MGGKRPVFKEGQEWEGRCGVRKGCNGRWGGSRKLRKVGSEKEGGF